ncbi:two-component regulator propeller domain-containing protein [Flammeovirgaceae bacterium SG7u.111]|nr:two-component regulator propeller domain-containing protein [Flammeovirgaceae bacterium SG7u.132]WPO37535.1 two-component regulator propeller domain-containing protein [Flammeovirgaceae bacterium SG7u.111]
MISSQRFLIGVFLYLLFCTDAYGQLSNRIHEQLRFKYITIDDGIANNRVRGLGQDKYGFIWIGTRKDISRFDGYSVKSYTQFYREADSTFVDFDESRDIFSDSRGTLWAVGRYGICYFDWVKDQFVTFNVLEKNLVTQCSEVGEDSKGCLWFSTNRGILKYDPNTQKPELFTQEDDYPKAPKEGSLFKLVVASNDDVWFGYLKNGVGRYSAEEGVFYHYTSLPTDPTTLGENRIERLYEDKEGNIWVGHNNNGASKYDYESGTFKRYMPEKERKESGRVRGIVEDSQGNFWFGTQAGLYLFDKEAETFRRYAYAEHPMSTLSHNSIQTMMVDNQEGLWLGTIAGGVSYTNLNSSGIVRYDYSKIPSEYFLNDKSVYSLAFDKNEDIWVGTENGGLNFLNRNTGKFTYFRFDPDDNNTPRSNNIKDIHIDGRGVVWFGTYRGGMSKYNPYTNQFKNYLTTDKYPKGKGDETIYCVFPDNIDDDLLWVATTDQLFTFDKQKEIFTLVNPNNPDYSNAPDRLRIKDVCHAPDDKLVFGTRGVFILNRKTNEFDMITEVEGDRINTTDFVMVDSKGFLWASINSEYLIRVDLDTKEILKIDEGKNLPKKVSYLEAAEDHEGNLWLSSSNGLYKFEGIIETPESFVVHHYDKSNNVQSREYNYHSIAVSPSGEILFGGINGFNSFQPKNVKPNPYKPNILMTEFEVFGNEVGVGENVEGEVLLEKPIQEVQELELHHKIDIFSFYFTGLHYVAPQNNKYKYKLEGFDKDWKVVDASVRAVTYSNIPSGEYVFKVDGTNNDGVWSDAGVSLKVTMLPPWWETWWFRLIAAVLVVGGSVGFYRYRTYALKQQKKLLEKKVTERTTELQKANEEIHVRNEEMAQQAEELEQQRDYLQNANEAISQKNELITSSINYAQRIQEAILPMDEELSRQFDDHFVLFRPRDVVSGDFYWMYEGEEITFIAVVDCTGHGVPGAFMSMIGSSLLSRIVGEMKITEPAMVLANLHHEIVKALRQETTYNRDGMDMALCAIYKNTENPKLVFAGAKSSLFVRQPNGVGIEEFVSSRMSVGGSKVEKVSFTSEELEFEKGSTIYLTTDGYIDQHRASDRRRLGRKRFNEQLENGKGLPLSKQKERLNQFLVEFMGDEPQRDDIAVVGIKL